MTQIEIKIVVPESKKDDLQRFINICKDHGFEVTREGGGILPNWSGWYAELEGTDWCPLPEKEERKACEHPCAFIHGGNGKPEKCLKCGEILSD